MKRTFVVAVALLLASCGHVDSPVTSQQPEAAVEPLTSQAAQQAFEEWMVAENDGDCEGTKARVTQPDSINCDLVVNQAGLWERLLGDADYLSQYSTVTLNGKYAVIEVEDHTDEILAWDLERVDGRWLIVSDADDA